MKPFIHLIGVWIKTFEQMNLFYDLYTKHAHVQYSEIKEFVFQVCRFP